LDVIIDYGYSDYVIVLSVAIEICNHGATEGISNYLFIIGKKYC
jgi:hypothetical protein